MVAISCEVRKPSKKWRNGTRLRRVAAWATSARSWACCTDDEQSMAKPVGRAAITSEWSPKMESAWVATVRAAMWNTVGVSPGDLVHVGEHQEQTLRCGEGGGQRPGLQLWTAPAAPASLCISTTSGTTPQRFGLPACDQASANSPMGDAGGDRVDGDHLAQGVGNRGRLVPINDDALGGCHYRHGVGGDPRHEGRPTLGFCRKSHR